MSKDLNKYLRDVDCDKVCVSCDRFVEEVSANGQCRECQLISEECLNSN